MRPTVQSQPTAPVEIPSGIRIRLHPNLARIAAAYQEICERFARGTIDQAQAALEIRDLVARDDEGVQWTINPRDGGWLFLSKQNGWKPGTPPQSGLATLTAHDISARQSAGAQMRYNPDVDITWNEADGRGNGLRGATRRAEYLPAKRLEPARWLRPAIAVVAVAVLVLVGLVVLADRGDDTPGSGTPNVMQMP